MADSYLSIQPQLPILPYLIFTLTTLTTVMCQHLQLSMDHSVPLLAQQLWKMVMLYYTLCTLLNIFLLLVPSGPPINVLVSAMGPDFVTLFWRPPTQSHQNGIIRHYIISAFPAELFLSNLTQRTPSSSTNYTVFGLHPYTSYQILVAAVTVSTGPNSTELQVHTAEDGKLVHRAL